MPASEQQAASINEAKLQDFMNQLFTDLGGTMTAAMVLLGDKLGLYKALADGKPLTSAELAKKTGLVERYVREWLGNQAASGYVHYDVKTAAYHLPPEQACALASEGSPAFF